MPVILDACAMIAYLHGEPGADVVASLLAQEPPACIAHAVNLCEVFYYFLRTGGETEARSAIDGLRAVGVLTRADMDEAFWQQVGRYKVSAGLSLGDAFVVALAERYDAEVITSDHGDFESVAKRGICRVRFFR